MFSNQERVGPPEERAQVSWDARERSLETNQATTATGQSTTPTDARGEEAVVPLRRCRNGQPRDADEMKMNQHFESAEWVDYARGLVEPEQKEEMERHVDAGCDSCGRAKSLFRIVTSAATAEYSPPADVSARAKSIFRRPRPESPNEAVTGSVGTLIAQLILDTSREPLPAGLRSGDRPTRLLFAAGDYFLDLDLTREIVSPSLSGRDHILIGQIVDREDPSRRVPELSVRLETADQVRTQTHTNSLGEFELQYDPSDVVRLRIPLEGKGSIEVQLPSEAPAVAASN